MGNKKPRRTLSKKKKRLQGTRLWEYNNRRLLGVTSSASETGIDIQKMGNKWHSKTYRRLHRQKNSSHRLFRAAGENAPNKEEVPLAEKVTVQCKCRLCLKVIISHATPIWGDSGIYEKVIRCSGVTVLETDMYLFVCQSCNKHLDYINKFQQMCLKSNEIFITSSFLKEEAPFSDSLNQEFVIEPLTEDDYNLDEIHSNGEEEDDYNLEEIHSNRDEEAFDTTTNFESEGEKEQEYPCEECPMISFQEEDFLIHQNSHKVRSKRLATLIDLCPFCGKTFYLKKGTFLGHLKAHTCPPQPTKCDECGKMISGRLRLRQHKLVHQAKLSHECSLCASKLKTKVSLNKHMNTVHNQQPRSSCPYCDRKFNSRYNMRVHLRTHTGETPYSCPDCGISFAHRVTMKLHRLKEHKVDMFDPPTQKDGLKRKKKKNKQGNKVVNNLSVDSVIKLTGEP